MVEFIYTYVVALLNGLVLEENKFVIELVFMYY